MKVSTHLRAALRAMERQKEYLRSARLYHRMRINDSRRGANFWFLMSLHSMAKTYLSTAREARESARKCFTWDLEARRVSC